MAREHTKRAREMTDAELLAELNVLGRKWDDLRAALEESGGASGSPGEWIYERMGEIETEQRRRAS